LLIFGTLEQIMADRFYYKAWTVRTDRRFCAPDSEQVLIERRVAGAELC
jgi:hypothetical protein